MRASLYAAAALAGAITTAATVPLWRHWCRRAGHVDDPGARKIHDKPIPLAGGLAVLTGLVVPVMLALAALKFRWLDDEVVARIGHGFQRRGEQLGAIFGGAIGMTVLGWLDDRFALRSNSPGNYSSPRSWPGAASASRSSCPTWSSASR
jgi:UDP-GlcNAc:undecaprenyl-phosphate GlcNAc-1-phosphate transferase